MSGYEGFAIIFFVAGLILIGLEILIPGFGLPGIIGFPLAIIGVAMAGSVYALSLETLAIGLLVVLVVGLILIRKGFNSERMRKMVLQKKLDSDGDFLSTDSMDQYMGRSGMTKTSLKPTGFIDIEGSQIDALALEGFIEKDKEVKVVKVEGSKVFVQEIKN